MSDMAGTKAMALDTWCRERGQGFARFDYSGHGESGGKFEDGSIGQWLEDTLSVIDGLTEGPVILVGSSMGGWIMLLAALARPVRVTGLVGIASAPDFTDELLWGEMSPAEQAELMDSGRIEQPSEYDDEPYVITRRLVRKDAGICCLTTPSKYTAPCGCCTAWTIRMSPGKPACESCGNCPMTTSGWSC